MIRRPLSPVADLPARPVDAPPPPALVNELIDLAGDMDPAAVRRLLDRNAGDRPAQAAPLPDRLTLYHRAGRLL